jgi:hypothetical protein
MMSFSKLLNEHDILDLYLQSDLSLALFVSAEDFLNNSNAERLCSALVGSSNRRCFAIKFRVPLTSGKKGFSFILITFWQGKVIGIF